MQFFDYSPRIAISRSQSFFVLAGLIFAFAQNGCQPSRETAKPDLAESKRPLLPKLKADFSQTQVKDTTKPSSSVPIFFDVAQSTGLSFNFHSDLVKGRFFLPEVMGGGVGCLDFDRDGMKDLFFPNGSFLEPEGHDASQFPVDSLFRNCQGGERFAEVSKQAGIIGTQYGQGCAVADFDVDGFDDLYVANYGPNTLYQNNGDGTFSEVTNEILAGKHVWSTSPAWADLNDDGRVDLYVVNYMNVTKENSVSCDFNGITGYCGPGQYDALPDEVFFNLGNGEFREAAAELGFIAENGKGLAISVLDFDDDLKPEVYVANDMTENFLFSRTQFNTNAEKTASAETPYQNVAMLSGCAVDESGMHEASMGVACADFDADLRPDIYLTHYYHMKNTLYHNLGNLTFTDDSRRFQVAKTSNDYLGFGVASLDFDSNGLVDLFVANGHVLGEDISPWKMLPQLLENISGTHFADISAKAGEYFEILRIGRGAAAVDFDNDLDTDIAISHISHPASLLRNDTLRAGVNIGLILTDQNRNVPVGGRVEIECDSYRRVWPVVSGGSYLSSPDQRVIVSLPLDLIERPYLIRVYWPSSQVTEYANLSPDRYWHVREGRQPIPLPANAQ